MNIHEIHKLAKIIIKEQELTPEKIQEIAKFEQQAFGYDGTLLDPDVQKVVSENNVLAALNDDGSIVGHLRYKGKEAPYISGLVVDPSMRGQGIGTELIKELMSTSRSIDLDVLKKNLRAQALYERLGFTQVPSQWKGSIGYRWDK